MTRKLTALAAIASLTLGSFTTPAKAGNDELFGVLAGAAVLAIIAKTIHDRDKARDVHRAPAYTPVPQAQHHPTPDPGPKHHTKKKKHKDHVQDRCFKRVRAEDGRILIVRRPCRDNEYSADLPRTCLRKRWTDDGWQTSSLAHNG